MVAGANEPLTVLAQLQINQDDDTDLDAADTIRLHRNCRCEFDSVGSRSVFRNELPERDESVRQPAWRVS